MGEKGWGLIVAEASSFGSALRGLMGDELVFAVILHSVQRNFSKTRSRSMAIVIPSLAKLNQDVHDSHLNSSFSSFACSTETSNRFGVAGSERGGVGAREQVFSCSSTALKSGCQNPQ